MPTPSPCTAQYLRQSLTRLLLGLGLSLAATSNGPIATASAQEPQPLKRLAFGSCLRQDRGQPIWEAIRAYEPQCFLLLGDNIYGDSEDMEILQAKYDRLAAQPGFAALRRDCQVLAIWDDHDYGVNDGGAEFPAKRQSQRLFNDFFEVPADSPRRQRDGIYDSVLLGPPGQRVQILLLDTRFFRDPLHRVGVARPGLGPYGPHPDAGASLLGPAQWQWLDEQLALPADIRVIASSIQLVAEEHGWECWGNFPAERRRLLDLLAKHRASGVVVVSGDRHLAEISCLRGDPSPLGYDLFDVTSSSLNVPSGGGNEGEPNRHRVGEAYPSVNFGSLTIDWTPPTTLVFAIHDVNGKVVREQRIRLGELQTAAPNDQP